MLTYAVRRLFLMIPTLFGILLVNFMIIQAAPGGPVEQMIAKLRGTAVEATARISGAEGDGFQGNSMIDHGASSNFESKYRGARGLDPEFIAKLEKMVMGIMTGHVVSHLFVYLSCLCFFCLFSSCCL